ncbi:hypothetical protein G4B88_029205 [Cannabis sativa]|uniref:Uncharacterized protein n=1 Tax=Cannabis sativa TaxID=3483 RepID=A0A7J6H1C5_CANSA|nr:hypothetical protein G4B88_029205 [Cannabis sativa]
MDRFWVVECSPVITGVGGMIGSSLIGASGIVQEELGGGFWPEFPEPVARRQFQSLAPDYFFLFKLCFCWISFTDGMTHGLAMMSDSDRQNEQPDEPDAFTDSSISLSQSQSERQFQSLAPDYFFLFKLCFCWISFTDGMTHGLAMMSDSETISKFGSGLFLLVQVVLLLDFVHRWNDTWVGYDERFWGVDEEAILKELPVDLRGDINLILCLDLVR